MYITEGPRVEGNERFTNSIMFVFEEYEGPNLFVCTTNATLKSATVLFTDLTSLRDHINANIYLTLTLITSRPL